MNSPAAHEQLLSLAMTNLPTGIFICDKEGIVRFINAAYATYLHITPQEAVGRHITELIPDSGIPAVIRSGKAEFNQIRRFQNGGITLIVNRMPLFNSEAELVGALSMTLFDTADQVKSLLDHVQCLDKKYRHVERKIKSAFTSNYTVDSIVGASEAIMALRSLLLRYARSEAALLILGATGTGKELAAGAVHAASPRADGPFVCVNCAAIPKDLFESEVFGYAPGAFSGARREGSAGKIELADQGTLFLDEIGDLSLQAQAKLLRVLEEKRFYRLGSTEPRNIDFRLVAATNRDLSAMIAAGTFRDDLLYRINSMTVRLPPLKERREDIPLLVSAFLTHMGADDVICAEDAMHALTNYTWPGNVRELRNMVGHAVSLCRDGRIHLSDLPSELLHLTVGAVPTENSQNLRRAAQAGEAQAIITVLREQGWNVAKAARALDISRAGMYVKMRKLGISRNPAR